MLAEYPMQPNYEPIFIAIQGVKHKYTQHSIGIETPAKKSHNVVEEPTCKSDTERDIYGRNAFLRAAQAKDGADFHRLLKQQRCGSADHLNIEDYSQRNALILASMSGNDSIVQQLLETKVMRVDSQDMAEFTALMYATQRGHGSIVEKLLSIGADYKLCNINGDTAIILAARRNRIDCVKVLARFAKSVIDWTVEGECGLTAEQWAETNGHAEAAAFIRETIATLNCGVLEV